MQCRSRPSCSAQASQTASQSVRRPAIIWVHPRTSLTPTAAFSCAPKITDTEEVTGSNPVSPTSIIPGQSLFQTNYQVCCTTYAQHRCIADSPDDRLQAETEAKTVSRRLS